MPLLPLSIPKGQYRNGTDLMSSGRWRDVNLVRWHEDALRPVGGWQQRGTLDLNGTYRGMHAWVDNSDDRHIVLGSYDSLFHIDEDNVTTDITPATLVAGRLDASINRGWGGGTWGTNAWGTPRPDTGQVLTATTWDVTNWGEYLVGVSSSDEVIWEWDLTASTATAVSNAPTATGIHVTDERFLFALGASANPRKVAWSDQEDNTTWTATATNQAGDFELATTGKIMAAVSVRGQTLIITSQDAHTATYQGPPFVFGFDKVGSNCGMISKKAAAATDVGAIWMGERNFHVYAGGQVQAIPCEVGDYVFTDINRDQKSKIVAVVNSFWNEIWWFYPSQDSTENDKYVSYDYVENVWGTGIMKRSTGVDRGVFRDPMWVDPQGIIYDHEIGFEYIDDDETEAQVPYAETGPISLGNGDNIMNVVELIPDEKTQGDVQAKFKARYYPNKIEYSAGEVTEREFGPYSMTNPTSVRFQGRQIRMKVEGVDKSDWRVGTMRIDARQGSRR